METTKMYLMFSAFGGRVLTRVSRFKSHKRKIMAPGKMNTCSRMRVLCGTCLQIVADPPSLNAACVTLRSVFFCILGQAPAATVSSAEVEGFWCAKHCAQHFMYITSFYPKSNLLK